MSTTVEETTEITTEAISLLFREMGVVRTLKFLRQIGTGHGDYTKERESLFEGMSVEDIVARINENKR